MRTSQFLVLSAAMLLSIDFSTVFSSVVSTIGVVAYCIFVAEDISGMRGD